jgi:hypothetical protein
MTALRRAIDQNRALRQAKPRRQHQEHDFQTVAVGYLELVLPADAICTSIDHANAKSAAAGADGALV